LNPKK